MITFLFCVKQLDDDDSLAESREEDELFGEQNMKAKEKLSNPEVEEQTETRPSPEHNVPQGKAQPVRRQTQSGPLSPGTLLTNSDSEKGHGYYLRFAIS